MSKRAYGSGSKREKRPGVWELRVAGRTRTIRGTSKDAERALAQMVTTTATRGPQPLGRTLDELLTKWMDSAHHLADNTIVSYTHALAHLPPALRNTRLDRLQLHTFDELYADLDRQGIGRQQIKKLHTALSSALTEAVRWRWIEHHPARGARLPAIPKRQVTMPQADDIERIRQAADRDPLTAIWILLALALGARRGEVCALRWSNVDLKNGRIELAGSLLADRTLKATKTNDERTLAIGAYTVASLAAWRKIQAERALAAGVGMARDPYVLSNARDAALPMRPGGASQRFRRLCARAGVANTIRLNDLRHANISIQLSEGVPVGVAGRRGGHKRLSTTQDTYGHLIDGDDRRAADIIDARLRRS